MLKQAKNKLRQLLFDDSGVAMAFTIVVFLVFFMFCVSVYAMTENIRQKMELQNACDAAAYSAAVVQADMLSRIAVLNRALSWTYLHTNKRHMDYLVGRWAIQVQSQHTLDSSWVEIKNVGCPMHHKRGVHHYASYTPSSSYNIKMRNYPADSIDVREWVSSSDLTAAIDIGNDNMRTIMAEINSIRSNMNSWISSAVDQVWNKYNMPSTSEKILFLGGEANGSSSAPTYFDDVNDEATLLAFAGYTAADMGNGQGKWWNPVGSGVIQRTYTGELSASYHCHWEKWNCSNNPHYPVSTSTTPRQITLILPYSGIPVTGTSLNPTFFGKKGSIVVAAKRPMTNPFSVLGMTGLYDAFNADNTDMWAVSAARAGVRLRENRDTAGHYLVQYPGATADGYTNGVWNLCEEDWDGVLIPVSRAWNETEPGKWNDDPTAGELLDAVREKLQVNTTYNGNIGDNLRH